MKIDEFSINSIDGVISTSEQTGFLLFGFNIGLANIASFSEKISFNSLIMTKVSFNSPMFIKRIFNSLATIKRSFNSKAEE